MHGRQAVLRLEHHAEQAASAGEVAKPDVMAGGAGQGGVQDLRDLWPAGEPLGHFDPRLLLLAQAHAHRADAA